MTGHRAYGVWIRSLKATGQVSEYNRTYNYTNKHQHEFPDSHPGSIEEAEASTCGKPRQGKGIRWARSRRS